MPNRQALRRVVQPIPTYLNQVLAPMGMKNVILYFPLDEKAGTVVQDRSLVRKNAAAYNSLQWANGKGVMKPAPYFSGDDLIDFYSTDFAARWTGAEFTICGWISSNGNWVGRWCKIAVDNNNRVLLYASSTTQLQFFFAAGGTVKSVAVTVPQSEYHHVLMTVSKAADTLDVAIDGVRTGSTQTGLGTWAGSLSNSLVVFGADDNVGSSSAQCWLSDLVIMDRATKQDEWPKLARKIRPVA